MQAHQSRKLTYRPIAELKPSATNARRHSLKQIEGLARSIQAFGFNAPILIDRDM
jgi:ParB-like chromosome segregation protein Spo0J